MGFVLVAVGEEGNKEPVPIMNNSILGRDGAGGDKVVLGICAKDLFISHCQALVTVTGNNVSLTSIGQPPIRVGGNVMNKGHCRELYVGDIIEFDYYKIANGQKAETKYR